MDVETPGADGRPFGGAAEEAAEQPARRLRRPCRLPLQRARQGIEPFGDQQLTGIERELALVDEVA